MAHHLVCFLLFAFYIQCISIQVRTVWKPVIVSNSSLQNTTIINKQANVSVDVACSIIATRRPWAKLFCIVGEHCIISSFLAVPYPSQVPIADPVECMTNIDGCLYDGLELIALGDDYCPPVGDPDAPFHCVEGVLIPAATPPSKKSCPSPFRSTKYGCTLVNTASVSFCNARLTCLKKGSDLYTLDKMKSRTDIKAFMDTVFPAAHLHAGFTGNATDFKWLNGNILLRNSTLWHANFDPWKSTVTPLCGVIYSDDAWASYGLAYHSCMEHNYRFICQINISK